MKAWRKEGLFNKVIHAASLSVYAIGQRLAQARGTQCKHGMNQVDRLLSNTGLCV